MPAKKYRILTEQFLQGQTAKAVVSHLDLKTNPKTKEIFSEISCKTHLNNVFRKRVLLSTPCGRIIFSLPRGFTEDLYNRTIKKYSGFLPREDYE